MRIFKSDYVMSPKIFNNQEKVKYFTWELLEEHLYHDDPEKEDQLHAVASAGEQQYGLPELIQPTD